MPTLPQTPPAPGLARARRSRRLAGGDRTFRHGHTQTWYAAGATLGWWGPGGFTGLVVAIAGPHTLPDKAAWVPRHQPAPPRRPAGGRQPAPTADLAEIVRIYGIRHWAEQSYEQIKG